MKVTPPHTRLAPWRRIAGITNPDTSLPPGSTPPPTDPDDDPVDRAADSEGAYVVSLSSPGTPEVVQSFGECAFSTFLASISLPAPATAGNLLMLVMGDRTNNTANMNIPTGFTLLPGLANDFAAVNPRGHLVAAMVADGGEQVITFDNGTPNSAGAPEVAAIIEWSGFGGVIPDVDTVAVADVAADGTPQVPSITPTAGIQAMVVAFVHKVTAGPDPGPATLSGYTADMDTGYETFGLRHRLTMYTRYEASTSGSYGGISTSDSGVADDSNIIHAALEAPSEPAWIVPEPKVNDGDDATYEVITNTDLLRIDLGAAFRITSTRIRIAATNAGARTFTIKGANTADFSDEVALTTIDFTATGSLTAQDVTGEWSPPEAYRYYQLDIDDADTYRIHTWELFEDPPPAAVDDHGELAGLGDDDHPQYLRVRDGGGDQVSTIGATGAAETIDLGNGNVHQLTLDDDCTLSFTGAAAGRARSFRLYLWQDGTGGHVVTWPVSVEWAGGAPTIDTDPDTLSVFMFETLDGGTIWHGYPVGGGGGVTGDFLTADEGGGDIVNTVAASGATETLDLALGNFHDVTLTADCTFTFDTPASGRARWFTLQLTQDGTGGWTTTWPGSVVWIGGVAPTLDETASTTEVLTFYTIDGGTSWVGAHSGGGGGAIVAALDDLTDVVITTPAEYDTLRYNGSEWINDTRRWEPVTFNFGSGPELVWDGDDLVMEWKDY